MLLMIDNYDSFTYNLMRYFRELDAEISVYQNDAIDCAMIEKLAPSKIILSPGPCSPNEAGISLKVVEHFSQKLPILGVCLGHQTIAQAFGAKIKKASKIMHGKTSLVAHTENGLFKGLPNPLRVARYHSLDIDHDSLPDEFVIDAWTLDEKGEKQSIMGIRHRTLPIYGVQFHPEAVLSEYGHELLANFLAI